MDNFRQMGRPIDEEKVINIVAYECGEWSGLAKEIEKQIRALPTAERKGHWIDIACGSASLWKCSECGELFLEDFYYCPNCGARMERE